MSGFSKPSLKLLRVCAVEFSSRSEIVLDAILSADPRGSRTHVPAGIGTTTGSRYGSDEVQVLSLPSLALWRAA